MIQIRLLRSTLALLACGAALSAAASSAAEVTGSPGGLAWHSVSAPATLLALSDYAMQPLPDDEGGAEDDTTNTDRPTFEKKDQPPANQGEQQPTTQSFPGGAQAPFETLGAPATQSLPAAGSYSPPPPAGGKQRRGIIGLHPLALLVGLVALHIFVVTKVVK